MLVKLTERQLLDLRAALVDAESDRESFRQAHINTINGSVLKGYEAIVRRTERKLVVYADLRAMIEGLLAEHAAKSSKKE